MLDSGEAAGQLWYTMPYVRGESLRERIRREVQLPVDDAVELARQVALALDYAHREGLVHRDIKPENILLSEGQALVADFGLAKALEAGGEQLTGNRDCRGHAALHESRAGHQRPGRRAGPTSTRSAVCCTRCWPASRRSPGRTPQAVMAKRVLEPVPRVRTLRDTVPEALEQVLTKALARSPADRFQSAGEVAQGIVPADQCGTHRLPGRRRRCLAGSGSPGTGPRLSARSR